MGKATYPTSISLSKEEQDETLFCKDYKYTRKDIYIAGLRKIVQQIKEGIEHDKL